MLLPMQIHQPIKQRRVYCLARGMQAALLAICPSQHGDVCCINRTHAACDAAEVYPPGKFVFHSPMEGWNCRESGTYIQPCICHPSSPWAPHSCHGSMKTQRKKQWVKTLVLAFPATEQMSEINLPISESFPLFHQRNGMVINGSIS